MAEAAKQDRDDEIRKQCEFYFGDANLPVDKHLLTLVNGSENRPVPIKEICSFKKMAKYQYEDVVNALKASETFDVNDEEQMSRKTPLEEKWTLDVVKNREIFEDSYLSRSLFVSGFPKDLEQDSNAQRVLEEFFAPYGPIAVRMTRSSQNNTRAFTGSVSVIFSTEDDAKQLLDLEEKPTYKEHKLNFAPKQKASDARKQRDSRRGNDKGRDNKNRSGRGGKRQGGRGRNGKDDREGDKEQFKGDKDNWKERRNHDQGRKRRRDDGEDGEEGGKDAEEDANDEGAEEREAKRPREENGQEEKVVESSGKAENSTSKDGANGAQTEGAKESAATTETAAEKSS